MVHASESDQQGPNPVSTALTRVVSGQTLIRAAHPARPPPPPTAALPRKLVVRSRLIVTVTIDPTCRHTGTPSSLFSPADQGRLRTLFAQRPRLPCPLPP